MSQNIMRLIVAITKKNINEINNIYFHNAEISEIVSDYTQKTVKNPVKLYQKGSKGISALITFENTVGIDISFLKPWGLGIYIFGVVVEPIEIIDSDSLNIRIILKLAFN
jgi:hypothetical protein